MNYDKVVFDLRGKEILHKFIFKFIFIYQYNLVITK